MSHLSLVVHILEFWPVRMGSQAFKIKILIVSVYLIFLKKST